MPRSARRYDLYLPLADNHGKLIAEHIFDVVERRLVEQFRGLTTQQRRFPLRGIWQGETRLYYDQVIILTVLDFRRGGSTRFIARQVGADDRVGEVNGAPITRGNVAVYIICCHGDAERSSGRDAGGAGDDK